MESIVSCMEPEIMLKSYIKQLRFLASAKSSEVRVSPEDASPWQAIRPIYT